MRKFKTYEINGITREYFILNNKKALQLGWLFCIEVRETNNRNTMVVRNRYFTNTELGVNQGVCYWSKYSR